MPKLLCLQRASGHLMPPYDDHISDSSCIDTYIGRMFIKTINMINYFSYECNCICLTILKRQHRNFKFYSLAGKWHCFRQGTAIYVCTKQNLQGPLIIVAKLINLWFVSVDSTDPSWWSDLCGNGQPERKLSQLISSVFLILILLCLWRRKIMRVIVTD